jgi:hypothetical protein
MRPFRGSWWSCALAALALGTGPTQAAWNNVFQVCCHNCRSSGYVAAAAPVAVAAPAADGCCNPCQQQVCTTRYVQRCYYQPVTTYRTSTYYEPVTTYRTSYYYEPVCSYRYSCYYDPCTCSYQQVAQPVTSYRLRSQCCPVTSYLQRCCLQPVTSYQQMTYYEPVTSCCMTNVAAPCCGSGAPAVTATPAVPAMPGAMAQPAVPAVPANPPGVTAQPAVPPPGVTDSSGPPAEGTRYKQPPSSTFSPTMPRAPDASSFRQPQLQGPVPAQSGTVTPPPAVRIDRIAGLTSNTQGQVIRTDRWPQAGAQVLFVNTSQQGGRKTVTADAQGRFQTSLVAGSWLIYVQDGSGRLTYQQQLDIKENQPVKPITLVSR